MGALEGFKILIADDEEEIADLLRSELEDKGALVCTKNSGKSAADAISQFHPQLIISDFKMPNGDGVYLLEKTRELSPQTPFMLLTAYRDIAECAAYDLGVDAVLAKPFRLSAIVKLVEKVKLDSLRRWKRRSARLRCRFKVCGRLNTEEFQGLTENLSKGGMFLEISENYLLKPEDIIEFQFEKLENPSVSIRGRAICRWFRKASTEAPAGYGFEFYQLGSEEQNKIEEVLTSLISKLIYSQRS